jgi:LuxR family maltose regulon positive regulatory protein
MGRKANKTMSTVIDGTLYTTDENTTGIRLSEPAWSAWLEDNSAFYYQHSTGSFSARKQAHRRGYFWYAYKRIDGRLYKRYLGERRNITAGKLVEMAAKFTELARTVAAKERTIEP